MKRNQQKDAGTLCNKPNVDRTLSTLQMSTFPLLTGQMSTGTFEASTKVLSTLELSTFCPCFIKKNVLARIYTSAQNLQKPEPKVIKSYFSVVYAKV